MGQRVHRPAADSGCTGTRQPGPRQAQRLQDAAALHSPVNRGPRPSSLLVLANPASRQPAIEEPGPQLPHARKPRGTSRLATSEAGPDAKLGSIALAAPNT